MADKMIRDFVIRELVIGEPETNTIGRQPQAVNCKLRTAD
jgi:hypothetical protein